MNLCYTLAVSSSAKERCVVCRWIRLGVCILYPLLLSTALSFSQAYRFNRFDFAQGTNPGGIAVADFNHDGKLDATVTDEIQGTVTILLGKSDSTFVRH